MVIYPYKENEAYKLYADDGTEYIMYLCGVFSVYTDSDAVSLVHGIIGFSQIPKGEPVYFLDLNSSSLYRKNSMLYGCPVLCAAIIATIDDAELLSPNEPTSSIVELSQLIPKDKYVLNTTRGGETLYYLGELPSVAINNDGVISGNVAMHGFSETPDGKLKLLIANNCQIYIPVYAETGVLNCVRGPKDTLLYIQTIPANTIMSASTALRMLRYISTDANLPNDEKLELLTKQIAVYCNICD